MPKLVQHWPESNTVCILFQFRHSDVYSSSLYPGNTWVFHMHREVSPWRIWRTINVKHDTAVKATGTPLISWRPGENPSLTLTTWGADFLSECHGCWCLGSWCYQVITSHDTVWNVMSGFPWNEIWTTHNVSMSMDDINCKTCSYIFAFLKKRVKNELFKSCIS